MTIDKNFNLSPTPLTIGDPAFMQRIFDPSGWRNGEPPSKGGLEEPRTWQRFILFITGMMIVAFSPLIAILAFLKIDEYSNSVILSSVGAFSAFVTVILLVNKFSVVCGLLETIFYPAAIYAIATKMFQSDPALTMRYASYIGVGFFVLTVMVWWQKRNMRHRQDLPVRQNLADESSPHHTVSMHDVSNEKDKDKLSGFFRYFLTFAGVAFLGLFLFLVFSTVKFIDSAVEVPGVVIKLIGSSDAGDDGLGYTSSGAVSYKPLVRFEARNGRYYEFAPTDGGSFMSYAVGAHISVLYLPNDPYAAKINSFIGVWYIVLLVGVISLLCLLVGMNKLIIKKFKNRLNRH